MGVEDWGAEELAQLKEPFIDLKLVAHNEGASEAEKLLQEVVRRARQLLAAVTAAVRRRDHAGVMAVVRKMEAQLEAVRVQLLALARDDQRRVEKKWRVLQRKVGGCAAGEGGVLVVACESWDWC